MNISQAHEISIISFLEKEGFRPCRVYGDNYWYRSPLREEKIASSRLIVISTGGMTMACPKEGILWNWQSD